MNDEVIIQNSKDLTLKHLAQIGAVVNEFDGLYTIEIPPKFEKMFNGIKKRITFDSKVADAHRCEYAVPGSNFLATILMLIKQQAPVVSGHLKKQPMDEGFLDNDIVHNGTATITNTSEEKRTGIRFYFNVKIKSIKSTTSLQWIDIDIETLDELWFPIELEFDEKLGVAKYEKNDEKIDNCFSKATEILEDRIKPQADKYVSLTEEKRRQDLDSLDISHNKRIEEIRDDIKHHKRKLKEYDRKIYSSRYIHTQEEYENKRDRQKVRIKQEEEKASQDIDKLIDDKKSQVEQIDKRYIPIVDLELIAGQIFSFKSMKCELEVETKFAKNQVNVKFTTQSQNFIVNCDNCDTNMDKIHLCVNSHVGCSRCTEQCVKCEKDVCIKCKNLFNPCYICQEGLCDDCSSKCKFCNELTCENHLMECTHCSQISCYFCSDNCEICSKRFCNQTIHTCTTCQKRICQLDSVICTDCKQHLCPADKQICGICDQIHCKIDSAQCKFCEQTYSGQCVKNNQCTTCNNLLSIETDNSLLTQIITIDSELRKFKKWECASNSKIAVFKAKKMFGSKVIVYDIQQQQIIVNKKGGWR